MLVVPSNGPAVADQFAAHLIWMDDEKMMPHRSYLIRCGSQWAAAEITSIKHKISIDTFEHISGDTLELNELCACNISINRPLNLRPLCCRSQNRQLHSREQADQPDSGSRHDRVRATPSHDVTWQATDVTKAERAKLMRQKPCCLWFTGLSGAGKSTIANLMERLLFAIGRHTYILDGDNVRHRLCRDCCYPGEAFLVARIS
jgi:bifunctional enzyme CysN/CysC